MKAVQYPGAVVFVLLVTAICASLAPLQASAQQYPSRSLRVVVPFAPGGATDVVLRMLAPKVSEGLGQQVVVDNRPGGSATIGMEMVARAAPDGYTLGVANLSFGVNPGIFKKLPYDTEKDFALVSLVTKVPLALCVHPSIPARDIKQLVALAKQKPGALNYSSSGNASATHMATELFRYMTGIDIVHVPYQGGGPALVAVLSGQVSIYLSAIPAGLPHFKAGKLIPLGVTSAQRDSTLPDVPAIAEVLPGYEALEWQGIVVPAATPPAVVARLNQEFVRAVTAPEMKEKFVGVGAQPVGSTPEEFRAHMKKELETWSKVAKAANIRFD